MYNMDIYTCCGQLWVRHMICGRTCDELYHFPFSIDRLGIPLGSQLIKFTLARHSGVQVPVISRHGIMWSFLFNSFKLSANQDWYLPVPTYGSTWVVLWLLFCRSAPSTFPATWSTFKAPFWGVPSH